MTLWKKVSLIGAAALVALVLLGVWMAYPQPQAVKANGQVNAPAHAPLPVQQPQAAKPDNSVCLGCHQNAGQVLKLPNGDFMSITVDTTAFAASAHGQKNLQCVDCHTDITGFPHPALPATVQSARDYTLKYQDTCKKCHADQTSAVADSVHAKAFASGNHNAPTCADCHNPHTQKTWTIKDGQLTDATQRAQVAQICAQCHSAIFNEYKDSVHGMDVMGQKNTDAPTCTSCHGVHNIANPTTAAFRLASPQMCGNCHTNASIMDKYGLSTAVYSTYVADFHGTTITLFDKTSPEHETNKPVCYDCHGVHNIVSVKDPKRGIEVKNNMLQVCQRCHPSASSNFPASWMSHYIPDPQRTPLVYYVQLFYNIFIPTVLGGMGIFVVSDIFGKFRNRGKGNTPAAPTNPESKEK